MKKSLLLLVPFIFLIAGCSQFDSTPTSPVMTEKSVIQLPHNNSTNVENLFSVTEDIVGSQGGQIKLNESYISSNGKVSIKAKLKIPKNAFSGEETMGYQINDGEASVDFSPSMSFNKDLLFDLKFTGLDLTGIDPNDVQFLYVAPDGTTHPVQYSEMTVDVDKGILEVKDALITHFSRYIWLR